MSLHKAVLLTLLFISSSTLFAQDLIRKVPADANALVTFNNKAFFDHLNVQELNKVLLRAGFFKELLNDDDNTVDDIQDLGFDLDHKSYLYIKQTDSVYYVGGLIPLKNKSQFESIVKQKKKSELVNGLPTIYSSDKTMRISWDEQTVYLLGGVPLGHYFDMEDNKSRFGLLSIYSENEVVIAEPDYNAAADGVWEIDSTLDASVEEAEAWADSVAVVTDYVDTSWADEYDAVDSILAQDEYSDDYYSRYDSVYKHNDSIKNAVVNLWLNEEFAKNLTGQVKTMGSAPSKIGDNTLINVHVKDLGIYYNHLSSYYLMGAGYHTGISPLDINPSFNYGYKSFDGNLLIDNHILKASGSLTLDKEYVKSYKNIFGRKLNPKFYPFLDEKVLGFASINMDTEGYLKEFPNMLNNYYSKFLVRYSDAFDLASTFFDVFLDEKAIGKVAKGDNLFVLNGVTKVDVTYTDYEYDEDYNSIEIEKTKKETVPQFLWMFSSDDTRIFEKLIKVGIKEQQIIDHDGLFEVIENGNKTGIKLYVLIKKDMVFLGNEIEKLKSIQNNTFRGKASSKYVSIVKKNPISFLFNTKQIPTMIDELELPVDRSLDQTIKDLSKYGDFYMLSNGVKGNKFNGEIGVEFPKDKGNALSFLLDVLDRMITGQN